MGGALLTLLLGAASACEVPEDRIADALRALVQMDPQRSRAALGEAEAAFACAPVAPAELARYWLLDAALASFAGDDEDAADAFRAADAADPTYWLVDLGPDLLRRKEAAAAVALEEGRIELKGADPGYALRVDGRPATAPVVVPAGLHLVQLAHGEDVRFGLVVYVLGGLTSTIEPALPPLAAPIAAAPPAPAEKARRDARVATSGEAEVPTSRAASAPLRLHLGVGATVALGQQLVRRTVAGETATEPATKMLVPLELGASVEPGRAFLRATVGAAPMVRGDLLFLGADGIQSTAFAVCPALAGGASVGPVQLGGALGLTLPSRVSPAALIGLRLPDRPILVELRLGANLLPDRALEPALTLVLAYLPELA